MTPDQYIDGNHAGEQIETNKMTRSEISAKASSIAGALWDDHEKTGTLAEQLRAVANEPAHGTDGDLTDADRAALRKLADHATE